jgi:hypothetical protein
MLGAVETMRWGGWAPNVSAAANARRKALLGILDATLTM